MSIYIMSPIKFKKLALQYAYLKLEEEEIRETCSSVEKDLRSYLQEHYPEFYKQPPPAPSPEEEKPPEAEISEGLEDIEEEAEADSIPKNKDLKKLYRKIAAKTHPDKIGDDIHAGVFAAAARAYEEDNIAKLLEIAGTLNLELLEMAPESLALLKNNIQMLAKEIDNMKQSTAWAWSQAKTPEDKEKVIKVILNSRGIKT